MYRILKNIISEKLKKELEKNNFSEIKDINSISNKLYFGLVSKYSKKNRNFQGKIFKNIFIEENKYNYSMGISFDFNQMNNTDFNIDYKYLTIEIILDKSFNMTFYYFERDQEEYNDVFKKDLKINDIVSILKTWTDVTGEDYDFEYNLKLHLKSLIDIDIEKYKKIID